MDVREYIEKISDKEARVEAGLLLALFEEATGAKAVLWGDIFGFGTYHYKYSSGREGDFLATGFAIRKSGPTIYIMTGFNGYTALLEKIGVKYKLGKSCLYLKNLKGLNVPAMKELIKTGLRDLEKLYPVVMK